MFASFSIILSISALFSFLNHKLLKLPSTIGLMILAMITAFAAIAMEQVSEDAYVFFCQTVLDIDFKNILLDVMLSFLLFAGALQVNVRELRKQARPVLVFATAGVLLSTFIVGGLIYLAAQSVGLGMPLGEL